MKKPFNFLLYVISLFLLLEWLWPLQKLTDTSSISVFVIFAALCFGFSYFKVPVILSAMMKIVYILVTIYFLYYDGGLFHPLWIKGLFLENSFLIIQGDWWNVTDGFRSFLFFLLLWLTTYLIKYGLSVHNLFFYLFLTVLYVAVLDTFTSFDAMFAIIRIVFIGFLLLSVLSLTRLMKNEQIPEHGSLTMTVKWIVPIIALLVGTTIIAFLAPKASPFLPDPVPFIRSFSEAAGTNHSMVGKAGYDGDDSHLGGPFIQDHTTVFTVETEEKNYWRVETKDFYTGKGWEYTSKEPNVEMKDVNTVLKWNNDAVKSKPVRANFTIFTLNNHLIYPIGLTRIETDPSVHFVVDRFTERILTINDSGDFAQLESYSLEYDYPSYSIHALERVTLSDESNLDQEFLSTYTQLPDTLPMRVYELAMEITGSKTNLYEKVRAVENYFRMNTFIYDTKNVAVPGKDDDYVDQFLFETKVGYCDNFSSSMVVLLRAVGIPARWVKGYTHGEFLENVGDTMKKFEITNNNAHSWVEVYFSKTGWVPFEPTIGFSNPTNFDYNPKEHQQTSETIPVSIKKDQSKVGMKEKQMKSENPNRQHPFLNWKQLLFGIAALILLIFVIIKTRRKWRPVFIILRFKYRKDEKVYFAAYMALLKQLDLLGIRRKDGQTLREYAVYVDKCLFSNDMKKLTSSYEKALYSQNVAREEWEKSIELWENLIKMSSS